MGSALVAALLTLLPLLLLLLLLPLLLLLLLLYLQVRGPQSLDGYRVHYPAAADAATAAAAAAAVPASAEELGFRQQLQKTLSLISDCTLTIRDAQDSR